MRAFSPTTKAGGLEMVRYREKSRTLKLAGQGQKIGGVRRLEELYQYLDVLQGYKMFWTQTPYIGLTPGKLHITYLCKIRYIV